MSLFSIGASIGNRIGSFFNPKPKQVPAVPFTAPTNQAIPSQLNAGSFGTAGSTPAVLPQAQPRPASPMITGGQPAQTQQTLTPGISAIAAGAPALPQPVAVTPKPAQAPVQQPAPAFGATGQTVPQVLPQAPTAPSGGGWD